MMKDLCQKWTVKLIIRGAYRLPGTGIVECLEIIDVACNLKQSDGLTSLTRPHILRQICATVSSCIMMKLEKSHASRLTATTAVNDSVTEMTEKRQRMIADKLRHPEMPA